MDRLIEVCLNALVIASFVKVLIFQGNFNIGNIGFFTVFFIFLFLLLFDKVAKVLRFIVSAFSLYLFFLEIKDGVLLFSYAVSFMVIYLGFYIMFKVALFQRKISPDIVTSFLAIAVVFKILYLYFDKVVKHLSTEAFTTTVILIFFGLMVPTLEAVIRLLISIISTIDVIVYIGRSTSIFAALVVLLVIIIFGIFNYKLKIRYRK